MCLLKVCWLLHKDGDNVAEADHTNGFVGLVHQVHSVDACCSKLVNDGAQRVTAVAANGRVLWLCRQQEWSGGRGAVGVSNPHREREPASDCSTYPNVALRVRCLEEGAHWLVEGRGKGGVCGCDANVAVGNGANDDAVVIKYGYSTDILLFQVKGGRGFARVGRAG